MAKFKHRMVSGAKRMMKVLGEDIPVTVVDPEEAEKCEMVACRRVEDMPIPRRPSEIQHCERCNTRIWVAHSSPKKPPKYCFGCAAIVAGVPADEIKWPEPDGAKHD